MNKKILIQDLAEGIAKRKNVSQPDAYNFVEKAFNIIVEYLQSDKIVKIKGLGTFKLVSVESRESVDVNTGERITLKEYTKINFTPDSTMRDAVNKPFAQFETVVLNEGTLTEDMERMDYPELPEEVDRVTAENQEDSTILSTEEPGEESVAAMESKDLSMESNDLAPSSSDNSVELQGNVVEENAILSESIEPAEDTVESSAVAQEEILETADNEAEQPNDTVEEATNDNAEVEQPKPEEAPVEMEPAQEEASIKPGVLGDHTEKVQAEEKHSYCMHVEKQQIEIQKVEHQTVENQHIVQMNADDGKRRIYLTPWMLFFTILVVLLLLACSYYMGYQHSLITSTKQAARTEVELQQPKKVIVPHDVSQKDSMLNTGKTKKIATTPDADSIKTMKKLNKIKELEEEKPQVNYPQIEGGKYLIVGQKCVHELVEGETLHRLARRYYGDDKATDYIILFNNIEHPDVISVHTKLKIPELKLK